MLVLCACGGMTRVGGWRGGWRWCLMLLLLLFCSFVPRRTLFALLPMVRTMEFDIAWTLQGETDDELPERVCTPAYSSSMHLFTIGPCFDRDDRWPLLSFCARPAAASSLRLLRPLRGMQVHVQLSLRLKMTAGKPILKKHVHCTVFTCT